MSRIILTRYESGEVRLVVGYDHPAGGCFFQEFNERHREPEGLREGGYMQGLPVGALIDSMPEDLRSYVTADVIELLHDHSLDPDSGYNKPPVDLSQGDPREF